MGISVFFNDDKGVFVGNVFNFKLFNVKCFIFDMWLNVFKGLLLFFYIWLLDELWWELCVFVLDLNVSFVFFFFIIILVSFFCLLLMFVKFW